MTPEEFRAARERTKLTQTELAGRLDVTRSTIARWESGALLIDARTALAVEHLSCRRRQIGHAVTARRSATRLPAGGASSPR